jgi:competence protein ComEA
MTAKLTVMTTARRAALIDIEGSDARLKRMGYPALGHPAFAAAAAQQLEANGQQVAHALLNSIGGARCSVRIGLHFYKRRVGRHPKCRRRVHILQTPGETGPMKRIFTALLTAAMLAAPALALDDKQAKKDVAAATGTAAPAGAKAAPAVATAPAAALIDINSATAKQLETLDGIGEARSKAIIKARPYGGKDDLVKKSVLTQDLYDKIKDKIIAKQKK